jgi:hypothetical protein
VIETSDEGYALVGYTGSLYEYNFWLVKTDASGNREWNQTYGGTNSDIAHSVVETSDGGYALAGNTASFGHEQPDIPWSFGATWYDGWLIKTDSSGNAEWNQTYGYGGIGSDYTYSMVATSDGGYAIAGYTDFLSAGYNDFWLIKTDEYGTDAYLVPPEICIHSPKNNTCTKSDVSLNFTVDEETIWMGYSLDGQNNVMLTGNTTLIGLTNGLHKLVLYAEDIDGNVGASEEITFTVDNVAPTVSVLIPENGTYDMNEVSLSFVVDETVSEITYCLDTQENVTINGNTTLTELSDGTHTITVYATDAAGNTGKSETINFTTVTETEPPPEGWNLTVTAIALATVAAIAGTIILIYYTKRKKQPART